MEFNLFQIDYLFQWLESSIHFTQFLKIPYWKPLFYIKKIRRRGSLHYIRTLGSMWRDGGNGKK